jgi:2'-5' RNA ligase
VTTLRIFLAVFPPAVVQEVAARAIERLRRPGDGVSWVKQENLHYTIRFLGDLGEDGARRAAEAASEAADRHRSFGARLGTLGAFPNPRRARVLWAGLAEGAEPLEALAHDVEAALRRKGFDRADRPFAAHLTIGRVREPGPDWTEPLEQAAAAFRAEGDAAHFRVDRLLVVHSKLSPQGSFYTPRAEARLAGAKLESFD